MKASNSYWKTNDITHTHTHRLTLPVSHAPLQVSPSPWRGRALGSAPLGAGGGSSPLKKRESVRMLGTSRGGLLRCVGPVRCQPTAWWPSCCSNREQPQRNNNNNKQTNNKQTNRQTRVRNYVFNTNCVIHGVSALCNESGVSGVFLLCLGSFCVFFYLMLKWLYVNLWYFVYRVLDPSWNRPQICGYNWPGFTITHDLGLRARVKTHRHHLL